MSEAFTAYPQALEEFQAADEAVKRYAVKISQAAYGLGNHSKSRPDIDSVALKSDSGKTFLLQASEWPTGAELVEALRVYHEKRQRVEHLRQQVTPQELKSLGEWNP